MIDYAVTKLEVAACPCYGDKDGKAAGRSKECWTKDHCHENQRDEN
jgi:hypothetical protein